MSRSPVAAAFSCVAFGIVRLYVVPACRLMTTGSALRSALAAMIAPRKLQSFAAAVHAVAAAVSSVRSTSNVVVNNGIRAVVAGTARTDMDFSLDEFEDAVCVYLRDAPTKTTSISTERGSVLFMMCSQP